MRYQVITKKMGVSSLYSDVAWETMSTSTRKHLVTQAHRAAGDVRVRTTTDTIDVEGRTPEDILKNIDKIVGSL